MTSKNKRDFQTVVSKRLAPLLAVLVNRAVEINKPQGYSVIKIHYWKIREKKL